jgi:hypothetical protein
VELEVRDPDAGGIECANDVRELLGAVVQPNGGAVRGSGHELAEALEHARSALAIVVGGDRRDRRAADLGLELGRRSLGDDLAPVDDPDPVGELLGLLEVLGGEEDGDPLVAREMRNLIPERGPALDVEAGGRLVEEQNPGPVQEREREIEAALHPARVADDLAIGRLAQADALDQLVAATPALALRDPVQGSLEAHVLARGQLRVERRLLEGGADRVADPGAVGDDVVARDPCASGAGGEESGEDVDGRRLAGAVRAEEAVDRAGRDLEVDSGDGADAALEFADEAARLDPVSVSAFSHLLRPLPKLEKRSLCQRRRQSITIFEACNY